MCFKGTDIPTPDISLINAMQHPNIRAQQHYENQEEFYSSSNWKLRLHSHGTKAVLLINTKQNPATVLGATELTA